MGGGGALTVNNFCICKIIIIRSACIKMCDMLFGLDYSVLSVERIGGAMSLLNPRSNTVQNES